MQKLIKKNLKNVADLVKEEDGLNKAIVDWHKNKKVKNKPSDTTGDETKDSDT